MNHFFVAIRRVQFKYWANKVVLPHWFWYTFGPFFQISPYSYIHFHNSKLRHKMKKKNHKLLFLISIIKEYLNQNMKIWKWFLCVSNKILMIFVFPQTNIILLLYIFQQEILIQIKSFCMNHSRFEIFFVYFFVFEYLLKLAH